MCISNHKFSSLLVLAAFVLFLGNISLVNGAYTTYTDRTAWQEAIGPTSLVDFNSETSGNFTIRDFGPFTATENETFPGSIGMAILSPLPFTITVDGTSFLEFRSLDPDDMMNWTFDSPIRAIGFDWKNLDGEDVIELIIGSESFPFGVPTSSNSFFGVISTDASFNVVGFSDTQAPGNNEGK